MWVNATAIVIRDGGASQVFLYIIMCYLTADYCVTHAVYPPGVKKSVDLTFARRGHTWMRGGKSWSMAALRTSPRPEANTRDEYAKNSTPAGDLSAALLILFHKAYYFFFLSESVILLRPHNTKISAIDTVTLH